MFGNKMMYRKTFKMSLPHWDQQQAHSSRESIES